MNEPLVYVEDVKPDLQGANGLAWKHDIEACARRYPSGPTAELTVASWIVEARYAHPIWHSYVIAAVALRDVPGVPKAVIHRPGATHEVMVYALNPDKPRAVNDGPRFLTPANFHGQWIAGSDAEAARFIEETVQLVIDGNLSPDTDFRRNWIARFSASNMKGPDIPPGLVVVGGDGVTFVGTGKQNAETLIDVAAGPKPPAKDMH
jgi:hypothetical protein